MTLTNNRALAALALAALLAASAAQAERAKGHSAMKMTSGGKAPKMVAYDAKDKRYYSVAWAKAHGMHDKGGDPLTIVPLAGLPKAAKESKAMHGAKI